MKPTLGASDELQRDAQLAWFRGAEISRALDAAQAIYRTGIFDPRNARSPLLQCAVVHLLICLNDLLQKARIDGNRIVFTDDVVIEDGVADITDLVKKCRDAACHLNSPQHQVDKCIFTFNVFFGGPGGGVNMDGVIFRCEYNDDVAVYYGHYRFYLKRHGMRALEEAQRVFKP